MSDGTIRRARYAPTALDPAAGRPGGQWARRTFIAGLGAIAAVTLAAPTLVHAAEPLPMVGVIIPGKPPRDMLDEFRAGLRDLGYVEGRNIKLVVRWDHGDMKRYRQIAAEFARLPLRAVYSPCHTCFLNANKTVGIKRLPPVVGIFVAPIAAGQVRNIARHGLTITGIYATPAEIYGKRLQLLKEAAPGIRRVVALAAPVGATTDLPALRKVFFEQTAKAGKSLGIEILPRMVSSPKHIEQAVAAATHEGADGLIAQQGPFFRIHRRNLAKATAAHRLPSISGETGYGAAGGLMEYGASIPGISRDNATLIHKILKGAKAADLPIAQPTKINFVVNRKTAKALGIKLPRSIVLRATEVIE